MSSNKALENHAQNELNFNERKPIMVACSAAMLDSETEQNCISAGFHYTVSQPLKIDFLRKIVQEVEKNQ